MNQRALILAASQLTERDLAVLDSLFQHRFLTRQHIQALHFTDPGSPRPAQRRLHRLRQDGLVLRRRLTQPDGSRDPEPYYALTPDGAQIVAYRNQLPPRQLRKRAGDALSNPLFVRHALTAADFHCALVHAARSHDGHCCPVEWWQGEHVAETSFSDRGKELLLRPDGYVRYQAGDDIHHLLVEIDLATMSIPRLRAKLERYRAYLHSGAWRDRYPVFPKLLLLTSSHDRIDDLYQQLDPAPEFLLLATSHTDLQQHGPLAAIWQQPHLAGRRPLLAPSP